MLPHVSCKPNRMKKGTHLQMKKEIKKKKGKHLQMKRHKGTTQNEILLGNGLAGHDLCSEIETVFYHLLEPSTAH